MQGHRPPLTWVSPAYSRKLHGELRVVCNYLTVFRQLLVGPGSPLATPAPKPPLGQPLAAAADPTLRALADTLQEIRRRLARLIGELAIVPSAAAPAVPSPAQAQQNKQKEAEEAEDEAQSQATAARELVQLILELNDAVVHALDWYAAIGHPQQPPLAPFEIPAALRQLDDHPAPAPPPAAVALPMALPVMTAIPEAVPIIAPMRALAVQAEEIKQDGGSDRAAQEGRHAGAPPIDLDLMQIFSQQPQPSQQPSGSQPMHMSHREDGIPAAVPAATPISLPPPPALALAADPEFDPFADPALMLGLEIPLATPRAGAGQPQPPAPQR